MSQSGEFRGTLEDPASLQAKKLHAIMNDRNVMFGRHMFGDPAWNILLDLFMVYKRGQRSTVSDVCVGSQSPLATCLRYITILSDAGLAERQRDSSDKRRVYVTLTDKAVKLLTELFEKETNRLRELRVPFDYSEPHMV